MDSGGVSGALADQMTTPPFWHDPGSRSPAQVLDYEGQAWAPSPTTVVNAVAPLQACFP